MGAGVRSPRRMAMAAVAGVLLAGVVVAAAVVWLSPSAMCETQHLRFDPERADLAGQVSADQLAVLSVDGPPQAFTLFFDPQSGSRIEEWDYFTTGRELSFVDGAFKGGLEVPAPDVQGDESPPEPAIYPWEIPDEAKPECMVRLAGPAIFRTSALVLPGWNDGREVARLWTLADGGSMITVDGRLALISIDPGETMDEDRLGESSLFVGTLGEGGSRMGAILSRSGEGGAYRLSVSPRGQGTTEEGTEIVFDLQGEALDREFLLGTDARASVVDPGGSEKPARASGSVAVTGAGDDLDVSVDAHVNDGSLRLSGRMSSGLWRPADRSWAEVLLSSLSDLATIVGTATNIQDG